MRIYRFRKESWPLVRRRILLIQSLPLPLLAGFIHLATRGSLFEPTWLPLLLLGGVGLASYCGFRTARRQWQSLELLLDADRLTLRQANTPDITIHRSEVTGVYEVPGESLTLRGLSRFKTIRIAPILDGYDEVAAELRQWGPEFTPTAAQRLPPLAIWLVTMVTVLGLATAAFAQWNPPLSALAAAAMAAGGVWAFSEIRRNPHVDAGTRRMAWFVVLPILACVVRVIYFLMVGR